MNRKEKSQIIENLVLSLIKYKNLSTDLVHKRFAEKYAIQISVSTIRRNLDNLARNSLIQKIYDNSMEGGRPSVLWRLSR